MPRLGENITKVGEIIFHRVSRLNFLSLKVKINHQICTNNTLGSRFSWSLNWIPVLRIRIRWIRIILALWIRIRKKMRIHGSGSKQSFIFLNMQNSLIFPWKYKILNFFKDLKNILRVSGFYLHQILTPNLHRAPPPPLITREGGRSLPPPIASKQIKSSQIKV